MPCHRLYAFQARKLNVVSLFVLLLIGDEMFGQQLVNTTGTTIGDNSTTIEYSVGEIAITTLSNNSSYITQGLLQPIIVQVGIDPCSMVELVPTAFTPNNDGRNDCYGIKDWPLAEKFEMSIFNRWGELVFRTTDQFACWDGKLNGKDQPIGAYVYMIQATTNCGPTFKKGTFILVR
jgi:gliding motility-associated-like protein